MEYNVRTGEFENMSDPHGEFDRLITASEKIHILEDKLSRMKIQVRSQRMVLIMILIILTVTVITGCSSDKAPTSVDLTGSWHQVKNDIPETEMSAIVTDGKIEVTLKLGEMSGPYWTGTFVSGLTGDPTSFNSEIDRSSISYSGMADNKKFLYAGGQLSFELGAMGEKTIVYLERD